MNFHLSPEHIERYRRDGFLVVEDFLDSDELARWSQATDEAVHQRLERNQKAGSAGFDANSLSNQGDPDAFYAQVFVQCLKLIETHAGMRELILDPRLGEMAATLAGVDGIRVWHDQALYKAPFGNATAWHLDNPYWSFSSRDSLSIWVALDDATLQNGCLYYLPGTQEEADFQTVGIGHNQRDLFKLYPQWAKHKSVAAPCRAGSAVCHNGLVAHGAGANMTSGSRRAMTCAFMPDGSTFNGKTNVLPRDYVASLAIGDVLNNDELNPLVWKT